MVDSKTTIFSMASLRQELILLTLNEVMQIMEKNGYNSKNQIIGYILSGDSSYITSKNNARGKITKFSREELLMAILDGYLGK